MHPATPISRKTTLRQALHIVSTTFLDGNEVLVGFADGSAALYEAEELEKLRPTPKRILESVTSYAASCQGSGAERARKAVELHVA